MAETPVVRLTRRFLRSLLAETNGFFTAAGPVPAATPGSEEL